MKQATIFLISIIISFSGINAQDRDTSSSRLYFFRTNRMYGKWATINVIVNDTVIGKIRNGQRMIYDISTHDSVTVSGLYKLMNKKTDESITFVPEPGRDYFFEIFFYGDRYKPSAIIWTGTSAMQISEPVDYGVRIAGIETEAGRQKFNNETLFKRKTNTQRELK